jgi:hypothetical protein
MQFDKKKIANDKTESLTRGLKCQKSAIFKVEKQQKTGENQVNRNAVCA